MSIKCCSFSSDLDDSGIGKSDGSAELYDRDPTLLSYRMPMSKLTCDVVSQWYQDRVRTIERCSRLVDHALTLLRLGRERNIKVLDKMRTTACSCLSLPKPYPTTAILN